MLNTTEMFLKHFRNKIMNELSMWGIFHAPDKQYAMKSFKVNLCGQNIEFLYSAGKEETKVTRSWQDIVKDIPAIHSLFEADFCPEEDMGKESISYIVPTLDEVAG